MEEQTCACLVYKDDVTVIDNFNYRVWVKYVSIFNKNILASIKGNKEIVEYLILNTTSEGVMEHLISTEEVRERILEEAIEISSMNGYHRVSKMVLKRVELTQNLKDSILYNASISDCPSLFMEIDLKDDERVKYFEISVMRKSTKVALFLLSTTKIPRGVLENAFASAVKNGFSTMISILSQREYLGAPKEDSLLLACECESSYSLDHLLKMNTFSSDTRKKVIEFLVSKGKSQHILNSIPYWK